MDKIQSCYMYVLPFSKYKEKWMLPFLPEILLPIANRHHISLFTYPIKNLSSGRLPREIFINYGIAKFMGINKHNLQVYTKTFEFIHNIRRNTNRRKKMFKRILLGS